MTRTAWAATLGLALTILSGLWLRPAPWWAVALHFWGASIFSAATWHITHRHASPVSAPFSPSPPPEEPTQ